jgi:hypothetical protein
MVGIPHDPTPLVDGSDHGSLVGFAGNELVAVYRIRVGRQIGSAGRSARPPWWRTGCTPAPTGSPRWPSYWARWVRWPVSSWPTRSSGC